MLTALVRASLMPSLVRRLSNAGVVRARPRHRHFSVALPVATILVMVACGGTESGQSSPANEQRGADSQMSSPTANAKPSVPFQVRFGSAPPEAGAAVRIRVSAQTAGAVNVVASNASGSSTLDFDWVEAGEEISGVLDIPVTGPDSFVDIEVTLVTAEQLRFGLTRRLRVRLQGGVYAIEEVSLIDVPAFGPGEAERIGTE